eukprot:gene13522-44975_t
MCDAKTTQPRVKVRVVPQRSSITLAAVNRQGFLGAVDAHPIADVEAWIAVEVADVADRLADHKGCIDVFCAEQ